VAGPGQGGGVSAVLASEHDHGGSEGEGRGRMSCRHRRGRV
jgi:hypothetical protein